MVLARMGEGDLVPLLGDRCIGGGLISVPPGAMGYTILGLIGVTALVLVASTGFGMVSAGGVGAKALA